MAPIKSSPKVIIIGLDGADYFLTKRWMAEGKLPNLAKIAEEGVFGPLKSTTPPMTSPAWPSFMTGKNPGKHGVFDFVSLEKGKHEIVNSSSIAEPTIFEILSNSGKKVGVMNVPVTYPPIKVNGFMISGYPSPYDGNKISYPETLLKGLKSSLGAYRANLKIPYEKGKEELCFDDIVDLLETHSKYFLHFLKDPRFDFLMIVFNAADTASHFFWRNFETKNPEFGDYILKIYQLIDKELGKILKETNESDTVFIMSDHGFGPLEATVNLNIYFLQKGLLKLKSNLLTRFKYLLFKIGLTPANVFGVLKKLGLKKIAWTTPREKRDIALDRFLSFQDVDFEESICFSLGHVGQVYVLDKTKIDEVGNALNELQHPKTGEKIVEIVTNKSEVCQGPFCDKSPDLHITFKDRRFVSYPLFAGSPKVFAPNLADNSGHHRDLGIFFAKGQNVKQGLTINAHIYDLAPTILSIFGLPIDSDFDGKTLGIFNTVTKSPTIVGKNLPTKKRSRIEVSKKEKGLMREKLRDLGYLT